MADAPAAAPASTPEAAPAPTEGKPTTEQQVAAEVRKFKMKVNGAEREMPEEDVLRAAQKYLGGDDKFQQAAAVEKRVNSILESVKTNPRAAFERMSKEFAGTDFEDIAVKFLSEKLEAQMAEQRLREAPPEERERASLRKQLEDANARIKAAEDERATSQQAQVKQQMDRIFIETAQLVPQDMMADPTTRNVIGRAIVDHWQVALENEEDLRAAGVDVTPKAIAEQVLAEFSAMTPRYLANLDPSKLREMLGEKKFKALLAAEQAAASGSAHPALTQEPKVRDASASKPRETTRGVSTAALVRSMYFNGGKQRQ